MSRKTVAVDVPDSPDALMEAFEKALLRNDGVLPAVPPSDLPWRVAGLVGVTLPAPPAFNPPPPAATGGTRRIPEEIAGPMRTLYPLLKRQYLDEQALRGLVQSLGDTVETKLGLAVSQNVGTPNTARSLLGRAVKAMLPLLDGNENELETYGLKVVVGTAAVGRRAKGTPPAA